MTLCPHCKTELEPYVLDLVQCPSDWTVHEGASEGQIEAVREAHSDFDELQKIISHAPDMTLAQTSCPSGKCDL